MSLPNDTITRAEEKKEYEEAFLKKAGPKESLSIMAAYEVFQDMGWTGRNFDPNTVVNWLVEEDMKKPKRTGGDDFDVQLGEFLAVFMARTDTELLEARFRRWFHKADTDGSLTISEEEFRKFTNADGSTFDFKKFAEIFGGLEKNGEVSFYQLIEKFSPKD